MATILDLPNPKLHDDWQDYAVVLTKQLLQNFTNLNNDIPYISTSIIDEAKAQDITSDTLALVETISIQTKSPVIQIKFSVVISEANVAIGSLLWELVINGSAVFTSTVVTVPLNGSVAFTFNGEFTGVSGVNTIELFMAKSAGGDPTITVESISFGAINQRSV